MKGNAGILNEASSSCWRVGRKVTDLIVKHNGDKERIEEELELAIPWVLLFALAIRVLPILLDVCFHLEVVYGSEDKNVPERNSLFRKLARGKITSLENICSSGEECIAFTAEDAENDDMPLDARLLRWVSANFELISDEMDEGFDD